MWWEPAQVRRSSSSTSRSASTGRTSRTRRPSRPSTSSLRRTPCRQPEISPSFTWKPASSECRVYRGICDWEAFYFVPEPSDYVLIPLLRCHPVPVLAYYHLLPYFFTLSLLFYFTIDLCTPTEVTCTLRGLLFYLLLLIYTSIIFIIYLLLFHC